MEEKKNRKLVHGWKNGKPVVGLEGEIEEAKYDFGSHISTNSRAVIKNNESFLVTGNTENKLCSLPLNNLYYI